MIYPILSRMKAWIHAIRYLNQMRFLIFLARLNTFINTIFANLHKRNGFYVVYIKNICKKSV